jgi:hypothetical protein
MLFDFKTLIILTPFFFSISALQIIIEHVFLFRWHFSVSMSIIFYGDNKNKYNCFYIETLKTNVTTYNIEIYVFLGLYIVLRVIACTRACIVEIICIL